MCSGIIAVFWNQYCVLEVNPALRERNNDVLQAASLSNSVNL